MPSTYTDGYRSGSSHRRGVNWIPTDFLYLRGCPGRLPLGRFAVDPGYTPSPLVKRRGKEGAGDRVSLSCLFNLACVHRLCLSFSLFRYYVTVDRCLGLLKSSLRVYCNRSCVYLYCALCGMFVSEASRPENGTPNG